VAVARFAFEAVDRSGALVRGQIEAQGRALAVEQLISSGQTPVSLVEHSVKTAGLENLLAVARFDRPNLLNMIRELSSLVGAGLALERALAVMEGLAASPATAHAIGQVRGQLQAGEPLSRGIRPLLPSGSAHIEHLLAAGEASGHLPAVLQNLTRNLERQKHLRDRLISSLTYPAFLVLTLFAVLWVVFTSVLPRLAPTFAEAKAALPWPTAVLLEISEFLQAYGIFVVVALMAAMLGTLWALRREPVRLAVDKFLLTSRLFLRVPSEYEAARFSRNLETLLGGGLPLDRALRAARAATANRWFKQQTQTVLELVEGGSSLKSALAASSVLPSIVIEFAAVGEETGKLAKMLGEGADILERDVETRLDRLTALVLPVATLTLGLVVAAVMAAVVSGLLAVNDLAV
jgi:general secretion pathway protein F